MNPVTFSVEALTVSEKYNVIIPELTLKSNLSKVGSTSSLSYCDAFKALLMGIGSTIFSFVSLMAVESMLIYVSSGIVANGSRVISFTSSVDKWTVMLVESTTGST